jgi:alpha-galactosidase/6-phospho-beta-glucosidase family protein
MDINPKRLEESEVVVCKLARPWARQRQVETYTDQRRALEGADFVVVSFQIGGYEPATVTDFEVPRASACARPSPTRWAWGASCGACAPFRTCGASAPT